MKSFQGQFLVASAKLHDPNFSKTVVLLVEHNDEGAFGVVLNRRVSKTIQELWEEFHEPPCDNPQCVNLGGPVSGPLVALHSHSPLGEIEVLPGVFYTQERDHLERLVEQTEHPFKLFVGHSGWGSGQLESELRQGAWLTTPASREYVFFDEDLLWMKLTRQIGANLLRSMLKIKQVPDDPTLN